MIQEVKRCVRGHELTGENVRLRRFRGKTITRCLLCKSIHNAVRSDPDRNIGEECECGRQKQLTEEACSHCLFLDGKTTSKTQTIVIAVLRTANEMSLVEINQAVFGGKPSQERAALRTLGDMVRDGRVQKRWEENGLYRGSLDQSCDLFPTKSNQGRWVYRLTAPARGEIGRAA